MLNSTADPDQLLTMINNCNKKIKIKHKLAPGFIGANLPLDYPFYTTDNKSALWKRRNSSQIDIKVLPRHTAS